jgi:uncharacterized membrane protein
LTILVFDSLASILVLLLEHIIPLAFHLFETGICTIFITLALELIKRDQGVLTHNLYKIVGLFNHVLMCIDGD